MQLSMKERQILEWLSEYYERHERTDLLEIIQTLSTDDEKKLEETYQFLHKKVQELQNPPANTAAANTAQNGPASQDFNYCVLLAFCLKYGVGVSVKNPSEQIQKADEYLELAHAQNIVIASTLLAYFNKYSNPKRSNELLTLAASKGEHIAQILLAFGNWLNHERNSNSKEAEEAKLVLETISKTSKSQYGQFMGALLESFSRIGTNRDRAVATYKELAEIGYSLAQSGLAIELFNRELKNDESLRDFKEMIGWARTSIEQKDGQGAFIMSQLQRVLNSADISKFDINLFVYYLQLSVQYGRIYLMEEPLNALLTYKINCHFNHKALNALRTAYVAIRDAVKTAKFSAVHEIYNLGFFLYHGIGLIPKEFENSVLFERAIDLIKQAANRQLPLAQIHYAYCLEFGVGVQRSLSDAYRYYEKAYETNDIDHSIHYGIDKAFWQWVYDKHLEYQALWFPLEQVLGRWFPNQILTGTPRTLIAEYAFERKLRVSELHLKTYCPLFENFEPNKNVLLTPEDNQKVAHQQKKAIEELVYTTIADYAAFFEDNAVTEPKPHIFLKNPREKGRIIHLSLFIKRNLEWLSEYYERQNHQNILEIIQILSSGDEKKLKNIYQLLNKKVEEKESDYNYMFLLGFCLKIGLGGAEQNQRGEKYIEKAHEQGILIATVFLANCKKYYKEKKARANLLALAASRGEYFSQISRLIEEDDSELEPEMREKGLQSISGKTQSAYAYLMYAMALFNNGKQNQALSLLRDLACKGYSLAQARLAFMVLRLEAEKDEQLQDFQECMEWAEKSLEQHNGDGAYIMATMVSIMLRRDPKFDYNLQIHYLQLAVQYGTILASVSPLVRLLQLKMNAALKPHIETGLRKAYFAIRDAVDSFEFPLARALYNLGFFIYHGLGLTEEDLEDTALFQRGIDLIKQAADRDETLAGIHMAYCYESQIGVFKSTAEALRYYEKAYDEDVQEYDVDEAFEKMMYEKHIEHQALWLPLKTALENSLPNDAIQAQQISLITEYAYEKKQRVTPKHFQDCLFLFNAFQSKLKQSDSVEAQLKASGEEKLLVEQGILNTIADYAAFFDNDDNIEAASVAPVANDTAAITHTAAAGSEGAVANTTGAPDAGNAAVASAGTVANAVAVTPAPVPHYFLACTRKANISRFSLNK